MSLSYSKSKREPIEGIFQIAEVREKENQNAKPLIIYYVDAEIRLTEMMNEVDLREFIANKVDEAITDTNVTLPNNKLIELENSIMSKIPPSLSKKAETKLYNHAMKDILLRESKMFETLPGYIIQPILPMIPDQRTLIYLGGPSGVGKTYWSSNWAKKYIDQVPEGKVFLFSRKTEDKNIDTIPGLIRVPLNRGFISAHEPRDGVDILSPYENSLLIFDDIEGVKDKALKSSLEHFKNSAATLGRQYKIHIISIRHKLLSGLSSITEFVESSAIVMFPKQNADEAIKVLKHHLYFTKEKVEAIFDETGLQQRWMMIIKPNIIVTEKYIKIV